MVIVMLFFGVTNPTVSAEKITLKLHNFTLEARRGSQFLNEFARRVAEKSGGTLEIKVFHGGSLGVKNTDILRLLSDGIVDAAVVWGPYLHRDAPALFNIYTEGAISTPEEHAKAFPVILDAYRKTMEKWNIVYLGPLQGPMYDTCLFCKEPVQNLEELQGKKVRVWSKQQVETLKKLDVTAEIIPQADMYMALQTGVVDCAFYIAEIAPMRHLQEVVPYESYLMPFAPMPTALGFSQKAWGKLSAEQKAIVREAADDMGKRSFEESMANALDPEYKQEKIRERVQKGFKKLPDFPVEERKKLIEKALETWAELAEEAGPEAVANRKRTLDAIAQ